MTSTVPPSGAASNGRRAFATALILLFAAVTCLGAVLTVSRAAAVFTDIAETGRPGYLVLGMHSSTPLWASLEPGETMRWLVQASLYDAESGELSVELAVADALPTVDRLTAAISACSGEFDLSTSTPSCDGTEQQVMAQTALADFMPGTGQFALANLKRTEPRQLLVTVQRSNAPKPAQTERVARVGLGVHVAGEHSDPPLLPPRHPGDLPATGADILPLSILGFGLIGLALATARRRMVRQ